MTPLHLRNKFPSVLDKLPSNWEEVLFSVSKYYNWGREETWNCTISELLLWYRHMVKDYERQNPSK